MRGNIYREFSNIIDQYTFSSVTLAEQATENHICGNACSVTCAYVSNIFSNKKLEYLFICIHVRVFSLDMLYIMLYL